MKRTDYINIIIFSYKALLNKGILKLTIISLLLSLVILSSMLFAFWNAFPSVQWIKILFWGVFDDLLNTIWIFIISSLFIFLYPPLSTIVSGFYLDLISHKTNILLGNELEDTSSYMSGVISGIRILGLSTLVFLLILLIKVTIISNMFVLLLIQLLASGYILGKEYYEIVALKVFSYSKIPLFRKKHFFVLSVFGFLSSLLFMIPLINLIAPILSIVAMTASVDRLNKKYSVKK